MPLPASISSDLRRIFSQVSCGDDPEPPLKRFMLVGGLYDMKKGIPSLSVFDEVHLAMTAQAFGNFSIAVDPSPEFFICSLTYKSDFLTQTFHRTVDAVVFHHLYHNVEPSPTTDSFFAQSPLSMNAQAWRTALDKSGARVAVNIHLNDYTSLPDAMLDREPFRKIGDYKVEGASYLSVLKRI